MGTRWIQVPEAAERLGITEEMVRKHIRSGNLYAKRSGRGNRSAWLLDADEINRETELKARRTTPSPPGRMTVQEAAAALGTSPEMIRRWIRQGRLHAERSERGERSAWRVDADDIGREAERKAHIERLSARAGEVTATRTGEGVPTTPHWTVAWRNTDGGWTPASHHDTETAANQHRDQLLADGYTTLVVPPPDHQKTPDTTSDR